MYITWELLYQSWMNAKLPTQYLQNIMMYVAMHTPRSLYDAENKLASQTLVYIKETNAFLYNLIAEQANLILETSMSKKKKKKKKK